MVINRTKFDVCTSSSLGVKARAHVHDIYILDFDSHVECNVLMKSRTHHDNHLGGVIICVQFGVGGPNSFRQVNKNRPKQKKNFLLCSIR